MVCTLVPIPGMAIKYLPAPGRPRNRPKIGPDRRARIVSRDRGRCQICGNKVRPRSPNRDLHPSIDHIMRIRDGGRNEDANLRLAHKGCNEGRERLALMEEYGVCLPFWH